MLTVILVIATWMMEMMMIRDDDEPAGWPAVWEKGFKPPSDSSFMLLK